MPTATAVTGSRLKTRSPSAGHQTGGTSHGVGPASQSHAATQEAGGASGVQRQPTC